MLEAQEDVFYYVTVMNENYAQPAMPAGAEEGILRGMYRVAASARDRAQHACSCSAPARSCAKCSPRPRSLEREFGIAADVWSVTSYTELRRDGMEVERWNTLDPARTQRRELRRAVPRPDGGSDRRRERLRARGARSHPHWVPRAYVALGTDGFGRSDTRESVAARSSKSTGMRS